MLPDFPPGLGSFEFFAFIVFLPAAADAHQDFGLSLLEIDLQRYERKALLHRMGSKPPDLPPMQQQRGRFGT